VLYAPFLEITAKITSSPIIERAVETFALSIDRSYRPNPQ